MISNAKITMLSEHEPNFLDACGGITVDGAEGISTLVFPVQMKPDEMLTVIERINAQNIPFDLSRDMESGDNVLVLARRVNLDRSVTDWRSEDSTTLSLPELAEAYDDDRVAEILERAISEQHLITWAEQKAVHQFHANVIRYVEGLPQEELDDLIVDLVVESSMPAVNATEDEVEQDHIISSAEMEAADLNNSGKIAQIEYVLSSGFYPNNLVPPVINKPTLKGYLNSLKAL